MNPLMKTLFALQVIVAIVTLALAVGVHRDNFGYPTKDRIDPIGLWAEALLFVVTGVLIGSAIVTWNTTPGSV